MKPLRRFLQTVIMVVVFFVGFGVALSWYRNEPYELPTDWPWLLAALTVGALFRLYLDRQDQNDAAR
jgi:hypothetical protein